MPKHFNFDNTPKEPGIYYIYNIQNGKVYVGSSRDLQERFRKHLRGLRRNYHFNQHLQRAWIKYGEKKFTFRVIELVDNLDDLLNREQYWIDATCCVDDHKGYNIALYADRHELSEETRVKLSEAFTGKHHSEETKQKISEALTGRKLSEEHRKHLSEALTGREFSKETRQKLSESHRGKHHSKETRQKMSEAHRGEKNPNYGKHPSKETLQKISEAIRGKNHPMYGKTGEDAPFYGRRHTDETKQKMSESHKKNHRKKLRDYDKKRGQLLLFPCYLTSNGQLR